MHKTIGMFLKNSDPRSAEVARRVNEWCKRKNIVTIVDPAVEERANIGAQIQAPKREIPAKADLIVVFGGDGTFLGAARIVGETDVPIMGVNLGSLGFLTEFAVEEVFTGIEKCLKGELEVEHRWRLIVRVTRKGIEDATFNVLNDAVIHKGALARMISLEVTINDQHLNTYSADGLILASPTGSTAYNLSAGGPILHPGLNAMIINPICPHNLSSRPIVVSGEEEIGVHLETKRGDVYLTLDGQVGFNLSGGDVIRVRKSPKPLKVVRAQGRHFFEILRTKMNWG